MRQIPRGPEHLVCPLHKKSMELVCHQCPWWTQVRGANPNTGEEVDRWDCSIALLPLLNVEVAQQVRQGAAATESFRNEVVRRADAHRALPNGTPIMIEG
jgi:predicted Ser/Thr protein kinase